MKSNECCFNCKFWLRNDSDDDGGIDIDGECRRYPPHQLAFNVPYPKLSSGDHYGFPVLAENCWCGEFVMHPNVK